MRQKLYHVKGIVFLAILLVGCQTQRTSLPAASNEPVHAPVTIPPVISSATKLAPSPLPAKSNIPFQGESGRSTDTPYLQRTQTATDTPTPAPDLPIPEVRQLGQIGGVYALWQDNILGITFEIPLSWGKIEAEWGQAETGRAYNYFFDPDPGMLEAGGRSADFSIGRGSTWTDFGGFGRDNTTEMCAVSLYLPSACKQTKPDVAFLIALPSAQLICEGGPGSFVEPFVEVMINLPDNPQINGFIFVSKFLSPELRDEVAGARHYFLQDSEGMPAQKCDRESQVGFDKWIADFTHKIEDGEVDEQTALNLSQLEHLARSIVIP